MGPLVTVVLSVGSAVVGGIVGWFGHDRLHKQKISATGTGNRTQQAGDHSTQTMVNQYAVQSDAYITVDVARTDGSDNAVSLRNTSTTTPARSVRWETTVPPEFAAAVRVPSAPTDGVTIAPTSTYKIGWFQRPMHADFRFDITVWWEFSDGRYEKHRETVH